MSTEGIPDGYSDEQIKKFEESRIQDPLEAQDQANMLRVEAESNAEDGELPTAEDYDQALTLLDMLEEESKRESETVGKLTKPVRNAFAGAVSVVGAGAELLGLAMVYSGSSVALAPEKWRQRNKQMLIDRVKKIPEDYKMLQRVLSTARERLEEWKAEAKELEAQKHN